MANALPIHGFLVDTYHHIFNSEAAHQCPEHAGLAGTVAAQQTRDHSCLRGDIPAGKDRFLPETDHHAIHYEPMLIHGR